MTILAERGRFGLSERLPDLDLDLVTLRDRPRGDLLRESLRLRRDGVREGVRDWMPVPFRTGAMLSRECRASLSSSAAAAAVACGVGVRERPRDSLRRSDMLGNGRQYYISAMLMVLAVMLSVLGDVEEVAVAVDMEAWRARAAWTSNFGANLLMRDATRQ